MKKVLMLTGVLALVLGANVALAEEIVPKTNTDMVEFEELGSTVVDDAKDDGVQFALGAKISTLGVGPELAVGFNDYLTARVSGGWGQFGVDGDTSDVEWDADMKLASGLATVEWNVFGGGFHIDAGVVMHDNHVEASASGTNGTFTLNGNVYTTAEAGKLYGDVEFGDSVAPYVGIGWGNPVSKDSDWTVFFNLGVVFQGSPEVNLKATGTLAGDPTFRANLEQEAKDLEDELDKFEYYPVISLGVAYKF